MKIDVQSFSEYYQSKERLKEAAEQCSRIYSHYDMRKYCKVPVTTDLNESINDKQYISLKPGDEVKILWEYEFSGDTFPIAKNVSIKESTGEEHTYFFCWGNKKIINWVFKNTHEKNITTTD